MGPRWVLAAGAVFVGQLWIAALLQRHAALAGETWWHFTVFGTGSRSLRAAVGASVVMLLYAVGRAFAGTAVESGSGRRSSRTLKLHARSAK
jgi:lysylphosphatidylglycerol synthetase-like protein (DUF2156 family)